MTSKPWLAVLGALLLASCSHAPPQVAQVFSQVTRVFDPQAGSWSGRLSVFLQAVSADGNKVFDRLYLINDAEGQYYAMAKGEWTPVEKPGEYWVGINGLPLPEKPGPWRALLVTRSGQQVSTDFSVPPQPLDSAPARANKVSAVENGGRWRVQGWVDDYMVWAYDANGAVVARAKIVGPEFGIPTTAVRFLLYSYDKTRGEGLEAGPFLVKPLAKSADR
jgi:hypothetical protein